MLALAFLRLLVESKPVMPAPDAGAAKFAGGPSCTSDGRLNCWKRGGLRGSVCSFGVSGSVTAADCAMASAPQIATQTTASSRALRGMTGHGGRKHGTAGAALLARG